MNDPVTGVAVLTLGFAPSASAVVPGFDRLLHGNRAYLAITSLIGLAAAAGVQMLITASGAGLTLVMAADNPVNAIGPAAWTGPSATFTCSGVRAGTRPVVSAGG